MYLSIENKFGFIAVPRTGSHAFHKGLKMSLVETGLSKDSDVYIMDDEIKSMKPIGNFPTNPSDLRNFLNLNWSFPRQTLFAPELRYYVMMLHLTPSHLVKGGLINENELSDYNLFGFVRDPIKRWLSHSFLSASITRDLRPGFEHEFIIDFIRVKLSNHPYPPMIMPFMPDYFYHEGQLVATPYTNDRMVEIHNTVVSNIGGLPINELPIVRPLGVTIPENCLADIVEWLPSDCIQKLQDHLQPDIEFYNKVLNNEL